MRAPAITSGERSEREQAHLQARWDRGDRRGLVVRPADDSAHTRGEAWDVAQGTGLRYMAALAPHLPGVRWGGTFRQRDPVHFDLEA